MRILASVGGVRAYQDLEGRVSYCRHEAARGLGQAAGKIERERSGDFNSYHIRTEEGQTLGVSGAALESIFTQIPRKTKVVVVFTGEKVTKKGKMREYDVEVPDGTALMDPYRDMDEKP